MQIINFYFGTNIETLAGINISLLYYLLPKDMIK
jgi:hypothetical protein